MSEPALLAEANHTRCLRRQDEQKTAAGKVRRRPANHDGTKAVKIWVSTFARFLR